ncbi:MAG: hypothetical protein HC878_20550 [Leptolyngbyaceae cyanobacterium SL_5_14]|nr:hypothetical protein [Leptolyngbyaceae cyanobacterium SL_5_14]
MYQIWITDLIEESSDTDLIEEIRRLEKWQEFVEEAKICCIALGVHYGKNQFEESVKKLKMIPGHLNQILRTILLHQVD